MLDVKKIPDWVRDVPRRERQLILAIAREYEACSTIQLTAAVLSISYELCFDYTVKLCQCGLLDITQNGYKLKPQYIKEVSDERGEKTTI